VVVFDVSVDLNEWISFCLCQKKVKF
jgi:hypothetical protein